MKATAYNADYFGFDQIEFDFPCEIHFTRFGNTRETLHRKFYKENNVNTLNIYDYIIPFC